VSTVSHHHDLQVGQVFEQVVAEDLNRTEIVMYAGASGDFNPLHHDELFAQEQGYPSVFAHGMLTMGRTAKLLTDTVGDGNLVRYGGRFTSQVWPGDTLTARATVTALRAEGDEAFVDFEVSTANQDGKVVFSGEASARVER
jgi:acyl dehydratase